ncbi:hypothetical protein B0H15DRAFT_1028158 [Mycena belliarum]|uniref:Uncharacterized protein n=1 Tax=Mycena belliarum TaxID=1033014 RepID=A0AAD6TNH0_9AGAR|nr:hypothetical protein B0H15DRAFT_1028158 [Mycena belliae]
MAAEQNSKKQALGVDGTHALTVTSALAAPSLANAPTNTSAPAAAPGVAPAQVPTPTTPLERKIHPDLNALVADWTPPSLRARHLYPHPHHCPSPWSTFGRNSRPQLTDFGPGAADGSPAPSVAPSFSPSRPASAASASQATLSTNSQAAEGSNSGHGHDATSGTGSGLPSPASGFTFGAHSQGGRSSAPGSSAPPMPPLDHPPHSARPIRRAMRKTATPARVLAPLDAYCDSLPPKTPPRRPHGGTGRLRSAFAFTALVAVRSAATSKHGALGETNEHDAWAGRRATPNGDEGDFKFDLTRAKRAGESSSDTQVGFGSMPAVPRRGNTSESSSSTMAMELKFRAATRDIQRRHRASEASATSAGISTEPRVQSGGTLGSARPRMSTARRTQPTPLSLPPHAPARPRGARPPVQAVRLDSRVGVAAEQGPGPAHPRASGTSSRPSMPRRARSTMSGASVSLSALVTRARRPPAARTSCAGPARARGRRGGGLCSRAPAGRGRRAGEPRARVVFLRRVRALPAVVGGRLRACAAGAAGPGEKWEGQVGDDVQREYDARTWRTRCRVMAGVSVVTYVPFIVLVAVFVPRA